MIPIKNWSSILEGSLRISGIADTEGENPDDVVLNVSNIMNVDIALSDIDRAHRVGRRSTRIKIVS